MCMHAVVVALLTVVAGAPAPLTPPPSGTLRAANCTTVASAHQARRSCSLACTCAPAALAGPELPPCDVQLAKSRGDAKTCTAAAGCPAADFAGRCAAGGGSLLATCAAPAATSCTVECATVHLAFTVVRFTPTSLHGIGHGHEHGHAQGHAQGAGDTFGPGPVPGNDAGGQPGGSAVEVLHERDGLTLAGAQAFVEFARAGSSGDTVPCLYSPSWASHLSTLATLSNGTAAATDAAQRLGRLRAAGNTVESCVVLGDLRHCRDAAWGNTTNGLVLLSRIQGEAAAPNTATPPAATGKAADRGGDAGGSNSGNSGNSAAGGGGGGVNPTLVVMALIAAAVFFSILGFVCSQECKARRFKQASRARSDVYSALHAGGAAVASRPPAGAAHAGNVFSGTHFYPAATGHEGGGVFGVPAAVAHQSPQHFGAGANQPPA